MFTRIHPGRAAVLMALLLMLPGAGLQANPRLIVTIHPLYLLITEVAGDGADIQRLIPPQRSPHDYRLRPSERLSLERADAIFWLGPQLETGLAGLLDGDALDTPVYTLAGAAPGAATAPAADHQRPDGDAVHDYAAHGHAPGQHHDGDAHDWLDPIAAARMAGRVAEILSRMDPAGAVGYRNRAARLAAELVGLEQELTPLLSPMRTRRYWVAHDAYGQFEARFGLRHSGVFSLNPERLPGAAHVVSLQRQLEMGQVDCVFREPQYHPPVLGRLLEARPVPVIELDPLASGQPAAPGGFVGFLREFGVRFASCGEAGQTGSSQ